MSITSLSSRYPFGHNYTVYNENTINTALSRRLSHDPHEIVHAPQKHDIVYVGTSVDKWKRSVAGFPGFARNFIFFSIRSSGDHVR